MSPTPPTTSTLSTHRSEAAENWGCSRGSRTGQDRTTPIPAWESPVLARPRWVCGIHKTDVLWCPVRLPTAAEEEREGEEHVWESGIVQLVLISSLLQGSPQRSKHWFITLLLLQGKETINHDQSAPG